MVEARDDRVDLENLPRPRVDVAIPDRDRPESAVVGEIHHLACESLSLVELYEGQFHLDRQTDREGLFGPGEDLALETLRVDLEVERVGKPEGIETFDDDFLRGDVGRPRSGGDVSVCHWAQAARLGVPRDVEWRCSVVVAERDADLLGFGDRLECVGERFEADDASAVAVLAEFSRPVASVRPDVKNEPDAQGVDEVAPPSLGYARSRVWANVNADTAKKSLCCRPHGHKLLDERTRIEIPLRIVITNNVNFP